MTVLDWIRSQRFRTYAYGVSAAVVAVLIAYGIISEAEAGPWLLLAAAVLSTGGLAGASHYSGAGYDVRKREPATPATPRTPTRLEEEG